MIVLIWILNLVISAFNAWGCGKTWNETKHMGGSPHFMNWMGAVMSASGFTWCYMVVLGLGGAYIPLVENDEGVREALLDPTSLEVFFQLGYLVIIVPILGSGLAITMQSWMHFWRRKNFGNAAVAGYNTFAQVYNTVSAVQHIPGFIENVGSFFKGGKGRKSGDNKGTIIILLVVLALLGGVLTTYGIIKTTARKTAIDMALKYGDTADLRTVMARR